MGSKSSVKTAKITYLENLYIYGSRSIKVSKQAGVVHNIKPQQNN